MALQTLRGHDQYNTAAYGYDDRYRGVHGQRRVLFINAEDLERLGLRDGDWVDLVGEPHGERERRTAALRLVSYAIPAGCCAVYYPETNPLMPLESVGTGSDTPISKAVSTRLERRRRLA